MMIQKIKQVCRFFKYFILARHTNGHGIHSPFIYDFATKVLFSKSKPFQYTAINNYRSLLRKCNLYLNTNDQGAGSGGVNMVKRKVSEIYRFSSSRKKYGQLLSRMVEYFEPLTIVELGTSLGIGTLHLSLPLKGDSKIYTIDASKEILSYAKKSCDLLNSPNINVVEGNFDDEIPKLLTKTKSIDFIFIDGNHRKEPTLRYLELFLSNINTNSVIVFDDIHWSDEMESAWCYIKSHPSVRVCIDLFQFGIVFFRKELSKENYIIRY